MLIEKFSSRGHERKPTFWFGSGKPAGAWFDPSRSGTDPTDNSMPTPAYSPKRRPDRISVATAVPSTDTFPSSLKGPTEHAATDGRLYTGRVRVEVGPAPRLDLQVVDHESLPPDHADEFSLAARPRHPTQVRTGELTLARLTTAPTAGIPCSVEVVSPAPQVYVSPPGRNDTPEIRHVPACHPAWAAKRTGCMRCCHFRSYPQICWSGVTARRPAVPGSIRVQNRYPEAP